MLRKTAGLAWLLCAVALPGCAGSDELKTPTTPTAPPAAPAPTPPNGATFTVGLPIKPGDTAHKAYGLNPFGVHLGDHGLDGHPGWDFEFIPGSNVYAAADGTVQSVLPSVNGGITTWGIQIQHTVGGRAYRTIYGVGALAPGVAAGASIVAGQTLGAAATYTFTIGRAPVTFAMVHFQVDDFSQSSGLTNTNAVPPETFLDAESRRFVDAIFRDAAYSQELVEPLLRNPRDTTFPQTRVWMLQQGSLAARIDFTRATGMSSEYTYVLRDANGASLESGTAINVSNASPLATIDFQPAGGGPMRRGVYDIVGDTMSMSYASPGSPPPTSLSGASTYRTQ